MSAGIPALAPDVLWPLRPGPPLALILGGGKMRKNCTFFPPCGAKSRGSGGAPPTTLILLRNQRRPEARRRRRPLHARRQHGRPQGRLEGLRPWCYADWALPKVSWPLAGPLQGTPTPDRDGAPASLREPAHCTCCFRFLPDSEFGQGSGGPALSRSHTPSLGIYVGHRASRP